MVIDRRYKLSFNDAVEICVRYLLGETQTSIAARFNVTSVQVNHIVHGHSWFEAMPKARELLRKRGVSTQ
jgi:hypothetical protein